MIFITEKDNFIQNNENKKRTFKYGIHTSDKNIV